MKTLKYCFAKVTNKNKNFLLKAKELGFKVPMEEVKEFLMDNIKSRSWFSCYKLSSYYKLHRLYRDFWNQIIPQVQKQINDHSENSTKEIYYILKFLNSIHYECDGVVDANFIQKVVEQFKHPSIILLLSNLNIPKESIPKQFHQLQNQIISILESGFNFNHHYFNTIFRNGIFMQYWSSNFMNMFQERFQNYLSYFNQKMLQGLKTIATKKQAVEKQDRPKIQLIFEQYLLSFGYIFQTNVKIGIYQIDFLIGDKIIIELNGNHHYCVNDFSKLRGYDRIKNKNLQRSGYLIVNIDINDWRALIGINDKTALQKKFEFTCQSIENKYIQYLQKAS